MVVAPIINKYINPCAVTFIEDELELVAPSLPINRHQEREQNKRECECKASREQERKRGC